MAKYDFLLNELRGQLPEYMAQRGQVVGDSGRRKVRCINPLHQDKTPSMSYNPIRRRLHCFGCGKSYDLFDLIALDYPDCDSFPRQVRKACALFGYDFPDDFGRDEDIIITSRIGGANLSIPRIRKSTVSMKQTQVLERNDLEAHEKKEEKTVQDTDICDSDTANNAIPLVNNFNDMIEEGIASHGTGGAYFKKRGISETLCEKYRLFQDDERAYLPVFIKGKCLSYSARAVTDVLEPRYKNSVGFARFFGEEHLLFGGVGGRGGNLVVTESIFDALSAEECGFTAVALGGAGNVRRFLEICSHNPASAASWRFLVAGDADKAGRRMNAALCEGLQELGLSCAQVTLPEGIKDLNEALLTDQEALCKTLKLATDADVTAYSCQNAATALAYLLDSTKQWGCRHGVCTGFTALDDVLGGGLYTGLYILGAISSLGKTSFLLQMADTIAEGGTDVLFFTLEMSQRELIAKSISRITRQIDTDATCRDAFTAREVMCLESTDMPARKKNLFARAAQAYSEGAGTRLFFFEGVSSMNTTQICELARRHLRLRGTRPIIIIDYLQILKPADSRATDKQNTDRAVVELKRLSRDCDLPVFVISSFNRENYKNTVSMEAFKESGAVEYSSDVLLGLQYTGMGERTFDLNKARMRSPREVELILLKNRSGVAYAKIPFRYEARYSLFT